MLQRAFVVTHVGMLRSSPPLSDARQAYKPPRAFATSVDPSVRTVCVLRVNFF